MKPLVVADRFALGVEEALAHIPVRARIVEREEIPKAAKEADALIVRSTIRVDAALLAGSRVRFVATATVGDDHIDKKELARRGIAWANAQGSSTQAVVDYMAAVLVELVAQERLAPDACVGVVGVGRIGSRVAALAEALGFSVLRFDPPRAAREGGTGFVSLEDLLAKADVLCLHVPLHDTPPWPTRNLINDKLLTRFRGRGVINAARGGCVDLQALLAWLDEKASRWAVLDCWPHEPRIPASALGHPQLVLATPHIAGHSLDGKARNTEFAVRKLARFFGFSCPWRAQAWLGVPPSVRMPALCGPCWQAAATLLRRLCPIVRDDAVMRSWLGLADDARAKAFAAYRRRYPARRDLPARRVLLPSLPSPALARILHALGLVWGIADDEA